MELVTPGIGLLFWMLLSFTVLLFLLKKFAWKPILKMLKDREESIEGALKSAEKAKEEMAKLQSDNEKIILEAKAERDRLMKEAREVKEQLISTAKKQANEEAEKIILSAREAISNEKDAAMNDIKNQVAIISIEIAEKILMKELSEPGKQKEYVDSLLKDINLN
ncbi:MAG: ATP synthase F0 subunit B [Bacteroidetes bacterium GWF2_38_335]|nr:MAG: ATP synthase F0 subunit B [Bacteroidetes bacterium GWF2_38_335]OFY81308.1 MAG: ATP synthase F0 subunit B [Bacteroidetes bacterium RIFOXYA12_FULL_38_20]HBS85428.1 F0F1 ATP synthase subunit B [Bacteroidales bacterium]